MFQYIESPTFWRRYSKVWTMFEKSGDFITCESCMILLSKWSTNRAAKMSGHVAWWRSVGDKTTRLQYDSACSSCTQHQYPCRRLKIQRKHSTQTCSTCCFASEAVLCNQFRPQHHVTRWNCTISSSLSWPFFDKNWSVFSAKISTKFLLWGTLKARLHRRFLSRQLDAIFVALKLHQVSNMFETPAISGRQIVLKIALKLQL